MMSRDFLRVSSILQAAKRAAPAASCHITLVIKIEAWIVVLRLRVMGVVALMIDGEVVEIDDTY